MRIRFLGLSVMAGIVLAGGTVRADTLLWLRYEGAPGSQAETVTDSVGAFNGSAIGGAEYIGVDAYTTISGETNAGALQFDGIDDEVGEFPEFTLDPSSVFTLEMILRWDGVAEANNMIVQQLDGDGPGRTWLLVNAATENLRSFIGNTPTEIDDMPVPVSEWFYAAVTVDTGRVVVWMDPDLSDGIQPATYSAFSEVVVEANTAPFVVGRHKAGNQFFGGAIAEMRVTDQGIREFIEQISPPNEFFGVITEEGNETSANEETIAWWRFEEGTPGDVTTSTPDYGSDGQSSGAFTGSVFGEPFYTAVDETRFVNPGKLADAVALEFDGADDEFFGVEPVGVNADSVFTVEAIVKWFGPDGKNNMIMQQDDGFGVGRSWLFINNADSTLRSFIGGGGTIITEPLVPIDEWFYAAVTYNAGSLIVWMDPDLSDGIQPTTAWAANEIAMEDNDGVVIIGNHKASNNLFFGEISEIRITRSGFDGFVQEAQPPLDVFTTGEATRVDDWALLD